jgi:DNA-binding GntR family transcriptional regulator
MNTTFSEQAYDHILRQLLRQDLRPGDLLDRKKIARELSVSLIPVADAVQRLTYEGFLTTRRRLGPFVTTPSPADLRGQLLLREAIECQAVRLICGAELRQARSRLLPLAEAADRAADTGDMLYREDFAFHRELLSLTAIDALISCFERVATLMMFYRTSLVSPVASATYDRHTRLLDDLCRLSAEQAEARIRRHIRLGKEEVYRSPAQRRRGRSPAAGRRSGSKA